MDSLSREDLNTLVETHGEWCVSIYMPTVRAGQETKQNSIRFKNMLRAAEERLVNIGLRAPDAERLVSEAEALVNDADFWRHQSDGLALFIDPQGDVSRFRLPLSFDELVIVTRRFHLKPLLRLLSGDGRFYVLALSQGDLRLLEGTRHSVTEVDLRDLPTSLAEALSEEVIERQLQRHALGRGGPGGGAQATSGVYHGHGPGDEEEKQRIVRYLQMVDRGLRDLLAGNETPLVLAGVDYLLPMYAEVSSYPHLVSEGITGNPETLSAKELHRRAWELVEPIFKKAQEDARARLEQELGRADGLASYDLKTVLQAAHQGRVAAIFIPAGRRIWGVFRESGKVHVHPEMQPDDQDLLDLAAVMTYANGGEVYVVEDGAVPGGGDLAALFRF